jgi:hypothetical protein
MLQRLAGRGIGRQYDDLGEGWVRQFRRHRKEQARCALPDVACSDLRFRLLPQPKFEFLDRLGRRPIENA